MESSLLVNFAYEALVMLVSSEIQKAAVVLLALNAVPTFIPEPFALNPLALVAYILSVFQ